MLETLKALAPLAIPLAAIILCPTLLLIVGAIMWGGLDIESGSGKLFTIKLTKRNKSPVLTLTTHREEIPLAIAINQDIECIENHVPLPQPNPQDEESNSPESDKKRSSFAKYFSSKTVAELDENFEEFVKDEILEKDEFWLTYHLKRRGILGADHSRDALRDLAVANPTWAMPYAVLIDWALDEHDLIEARKQLDAGLGRYKSPQFRSVLESGIRFIFKSDGKQAALAFASEWSRADIPERMRAGVFQNFADLLKDAGDVDGYRVALEMAVLIDPSRKDRSFSLAYSYAESNNRWAPAIWHYQSCLKNQDDEPIALNNLGIIYASFGKLVAIKTYELAHKKW